MTRFYTSTNPESYEMMKGDLIWIEDELTDDVDCIETEVGKDKMFCAMLESAASVLNDSADNEDGAYKVIWDLTVSDVSSTFSVSKQRPHGDDEVEVEQLYTITASYPILEMVDALRKTAKDAHNRMQRELIKNKAIVDALTSIRNK